MNITDLYQQEVCSNCALDCHPSPFNCEGDLILIYLLADWAQSNGLDVSDPYTYSQKIVTSDLFQPIWKTWKANLDAPFYGVTNNGVKRKDLYALRDEGAPAENMVGSET